MEKIAVIANSQDYSLFLADEIKKYFDGQAVIHGYGCDEFVTKTTVDEDIIVISAFTIFQAIRRKVSSDKKIVIASLTLSKEMLERLRWLPANTKAYLVSIDYRNCMEVITMLYQAGFKSLELLPYYPGCQWNSEITMAITPGESELVPREALKVIDIGNRIMDKECVYKLGELLGIGNPFYSEEGKRALDHIVPLSDSLEKVLGENAELEEQVRTLLRLMDRGIIITDASGTIFLSNQKADEMLSFRTNVMANFNISEIIPELQTINVRPDAERLEEIVKLNGSNTIITAEPIILDNQLRGRVFTLEPFMEAEKRQHTYRSKITGSGHVAKYTFDDILGHSPAIESARQVARRMAVTDANIYLYGESGTGKELFAQSIHNASSRRKYNFVAVNCSALPESLLESELYGYEPGAFSGAQKGGRIGLFELAHNGTLFLDEIGEMPMSAQAKLLRAIEEKKILKVGGTDLIDVDVRIITATSRDLYNMVQEHRFREDLYYRLCVLPVELPPLRQRFQDIPEIITAFKKEIGATFTFSEGAYERLMHHSWPGNVREVKNVVEYLGALGKPVIEADDMPFHDENTVRAQYDTDSVGMKAAELYMNAAEAIPLKNKPLWMFILTQLNMRYGTTEKTGRQKLAGIAAEGNYPFTEQEIKTAMAKLRDLGYISSGAGRRGSAITEKGRNLLDDMNRQ